MTTFIGKVRDSLEEANAEGKFVRTASGYREVIGSQAFPVEAHRYHLYISLACPWANRCLAMLKLKGLEEIVGVTVVHPVWQRTRPENPEDSHCGWAFYDSASQEKWSNPKGMGSFSPQKCTLDVDSSLHFVRDLYERSDDRIGKYSVPVLWDKKRQTIVNNESSEIVRMFNSTFSDYSKGPFAGHDFYPAELREEVDAVNDWVYTDINDGVYKCGFARSQQAYDEAVERLYAALDRVESILSKQRYLVGDGQVLTEADLRLFMTLVRFDEVYVVYFKCNKRRVADYEHIHQYLRELYQLPNMADCIDMDHIKMHYFASHPLLNAYAIIPKGPDVLADLKLPHDRNVRFPLLK